MAGGGGGGGDKRSANADINLVPYIDLLSTLICFLLITAVWQQVSVISTNSAPTPPAPPEDSFNPNPIDENKIDLSVKLFPGFIEITAGKNVQPVNYINGKIDREKVKTLVQQWKKQYPDKKEITINSEPKIPYKLLVQAMDILIEENYTGLSINTN